MAPVAREALVLVAYGGHGIVQTEDGEKRPAKFRRAVGRPICGDRVRVGQADAASLVVEALLPRRNCFMRGDAKGRAQPVAANLDQVLIVVAARPAPSQDILDRYLLAVHSLGIEPVIVHNKVDLPPQDVAGVLGRLDGYAELGYAIIPTSCKTDPGVSALAERVRGATSILVGQSGVGKSSLIHALLPDLDIQVGELSRVTGKGTHTTTTTTLYAVPGHGHLIDSPGVWEYGLWTLEDRDIALGYPEFSACQGLCRFNDCLHAGEPGCAVRAAVERGEIKQWRYAAYRRLLAQNGNH